MNLPETPERGMKSDTHVSQPAVAGQRAMLPSLPRLRELSHHVLSIQAADFCRGAAYAVRGHLPWGAGTSASFKSVQKCPFLWCKGLVRAGGWQERGGRCRGARGRGEERGQSQASARREDAGWCPLSHQGHIEGKEGPGQRWDLLQAQGSPGMSIPRPRVPPLPPGPQRTAGPPSRTEGCGTWDGAGCRTGGHGGVPGAGQGSWRGFPSTWDTPDGIKAARRKDQRGPERRGRASGVG